MKLKKNFLFLKLFKFCWKKEGKYILILFSLLIPKIIFPFISLLSLQKVLNLINLNEKKDIIMAISSIYFLSLIFLNISNILFEYFQGIFKGKLNFDVNLSIINKSLDLSLEDYEDSNTYDILQKALQETQTPYQSIMNIFNLVNNIITFVGSIFILVLWKWYLVLILLVFPIISFYFTIIIRKYEFEITQSKISDGRKLSYYRLLLSDIMSYKENKISNNEKYLFNKFEKIFNSFVKKDKKILKYVALNNTLFQTLETLLGIILIYFIFKSLIIKLILIGSAYMYINCIWNITKTSEALVSNISDIFNKKQYLENLFNFINDNNNTSNCNENKIKLKSINTIEFKNFNFKYREGTPYILKNINLKINTKEKIVIVGKNGSGKSTFIKLLCGFYSNYEGEILFNGISLKKIDKESLYEKMGVVFQDFVKYEFSLEENLKISNLKKTDKEILEHINYLKRNGIMKFIDNNINLNTQLGHKFDNGIQLSGGQWQQLAFSKIILKDADVFVMDEPSAGLDIFAEENMYNILDERAKNSICFLVTHRLYILDKKKYRALVFNNGEIVEDDRISNLLKRKSLYRKILNKMIIRDKIYK